MEPEPQFDILCLPYLAYQHVVRTSNVREQYKMATLSEKMKSLVRSIHSKRGVKATIQFGTVTTFILENEKMRNKFSFILWPPILRVYPTLDSIRQQIQFIREVFRLQSFSAFFLYRYPHGLESAVIFPLKQENLRLQKVTICCKLGRLDYEAVLDGCSDAQELDLWRADNITINRLMKYSMKCQAISMARRKFTAGELNRFLKRWVEGSKIEDFLCVLEDPSNFPMVFNGLDVKPVRQAVNTILHENVKYKPGQCFLVKQTSDVEAIVHLEHDYFFTITTHFTLDLTIDLSSQDERPMEIDHDDDVEDADLNYSDPASSESDDSSDDSSEDSSDDSSDDSSEDSSEEDEEKAGEDAAEERDEEEEGLLEEDNEDSDTGYIGEGENSSDEDEESEAENN